MKTRKRIQKERRKKLLLIIGIILICIVAKLTIFDKDKTNKKIDAELAKAMEYEEVKDGDENIEGTDYVNFDAFFLRDIDGDGYADNIRGTCRQIGKDDTLYMELNVISNGRLENGKITVNAENFYFQTAIVKDNEISNNYISTNTKVIELKTIENGTQKLITGQVRSGDYSNDIRKAEAIGTDTSKYSKINSITLTGTHVADDGTVTEIEKKVDFNIDWYGETKASIPANKNINKYEITDLKSLTNEEGLNLSFQVTTAEEKNELILKDSHLEGTMPDLNGYAPTKVEITGTNVTYTYDEETQTFQATREAKVNGDQVTTLANSSQNWTTRYNTYTINATYPMEAYEQIGENELEIKIPVKAYYEGYNNPNSEFNNPYKSNEAMATLIAKWLVPGDTIDIKVGEYVSNPFSRYVVSKENPLKIYNRIIEEELNDTYEVRWNVHVNGNNAVDGLIMSETKDGTSSKTSDEFVKSDAKTETMENVTSNKGIYFSSPLEMLGEEGWIKVYNDETGEELATFTKDNWDTYTKQNPYLYEQNVKHIRVETSTANADSNIIVYNVKVLDDDYITKNYTLEQFENLSYIRSKLELYYNNNGTKTYVGKAEDEAYYEMPISIANISVKDTAISTQEEHMNQIITISTTSQNYNQIKWVNGEFLVKLPEEIIGAEINNVTISNEKVKIIGYDLYEEDGSYFIKILTENEEEATYDIKIDCNITPDPRSITVTKNIELYAASENGVNYYYAGEDKYDVNGNLNTTEKVNKTDTGITFVSPNSLLTNQSASNYDKIGSVTIAPRVAKTDKNQRKANVDIEITNNYTSTISEIMILGKIPFKGNTYVLNNKDLGSTYSTTMSEGGITIPEELKPYVTVYYSENENPTRDLQNTLNGWTTTPEDWNKVKTYLIDLSKYVMPEDVKYKFTYKINIPEGINYNEISYSEHAIYFCLDTPEGKYRTQTEPTKLGFMIAKQFDLEITKYQENTEKKLEGIAFSITEEGAEDSKIKVTDSEGKLMVTGLYIEKTYIIKEIKTTKDYELLEEEIKFTTYEDENENPQIILISGTPKRMEVVKEEGKDWKVGVDLEDKVRAKLKIVKTDSSTGLPVRSTKFKITGRDKNTIVTTNSKGEALAQGLYMGEEYTLEEIKADGYYIINPIQVKITSAESGFVVEKTDNSSYTVTTENEIPTLTLNIENEKIPTYNLEITKYEKDKEITIEGAQFELYSYDQDKKEIYTTNKEGKISLQGLYEYVEGKNITGKYSLKEIYAPAGYSVNSTELIFRAERKDGNLTLTVIGGQDLISDGECSGVAYDESGTEITTKEIVIENTTIGITVRDESIFSLSKTDSVTGDPVEGARFAIYKIDENNEIIEPAKDIEGNILGEKEIINGNEYYVLKTDSAGRITGNLGEGLYKAVEVEVPEGYVFEEDEEKRTQYFGIGQSKPAEYQVDEKWSNEIEGAGRVSVVNVKETADGGFILLGSYTNNLEFAENETTNGSKISIGKPGNISTIIIKYDNKDKIEWIKTATGNSCEPKQIDINSQGKIYVIATTYENLTLYSYGNVAQESIKPDYKGGRDTVAIVINSNGTVDNLWTIGGKQEDQICQVKATSDGGMIIAGWTTGDITFDNTEDGEEINIIHNNLRDGIVVKYNKDYQVQWVSHIDYDVTTSINSVDEINENEFIIYGTVQFSSDNPLIIPAENTADKTSDIYISGGNMLEIQYDKDGFIKKAKSYGENSYTTGGGDTHSIVSTNDGYILLEGAFTKCLIDKSETINNTEISIGMNCGIIKYNKQGLAEWAITLPRNLGTTSAKIIQTSDDGFLLTGTFKTTFSVSGKYTMDGNDIEIKKDGGDEEAFIIKINKEGKVLWGKSLGGNGNESCIRAIERKGENNEQVYSLFGNFNGKIIGTEDSLGMVKVDYDINGNEMKYTNLDIAENNISYNDIVYSNDNGCVVVGSFSGKLIIPADQTTQKKEEIVRYSNDGTDALIIKYDELGQVEWVNTSGGGGSNDIFNAVENLEDGYIAGGTNGGSDGKTFTIPAEDTAKGEPIEMKNVGLIIVKYNNLGKVEFAKSISAGRWCSMSDIKKTDDGYAVLGYLNDAKMVIPAEDTIDEKSKEIVQKGFTGILIKYNSDNKIEWIDSQDTSNGGNMKFKKLSYKDGNYVITNSLSNSSLNMIIKYDSQRKCNI